MQASSSSRVKTAVKFFCDDQMSSCISWMPHVAFAVEPASSESDALDEKCEPALPSKGSHFQHRDVRIRYSILQNPSWPECLVLGFQVCCRTCTDVPLPQCSLDILSDEVAVRGRTSLTECCLFLLQHYLTMLGSTVSSCPQRHARRCLLTHHAPCQPACCCDTDMERNASMRRLLVVF